MAFIKAGTTADLKKNNYKVLSIFAKKIGLFKKDDGSFYAIEVTCKHQKANLLQNGMPKDTKVIKCYRHGWEYDLETGKCLSNDNEYSNLRFFDVKIENDIIYISSEPIMQANDEDYDDFPF
jgi:nitrite reductase/ring-hydroxylating ferredoxin subunit